MKKRVTILEGTVERDEYGWSGRAAGLYIGGDNVESEVDEFEGQKVRITIEPMPAGDDA